MMRKAEYRRNRAFDIVILAGVLFWAFALPAIDRFKESRTYRDLAGLTPFSNVSVTRSVVSDRGLIVYGALRKERCTFNFLSAYVLTDTGRRVRVAIDTSVEDAASGGGGNRPVSGQTEEWGPWEILHYPEVFGHAIWWQVYAHHLLCPTEPLRQNNLFAEGPWVDSAAPLEVKD